ncbi:hypothetical protein SL1157_A0243 [Ruegeria lacuscaerulensis ITI-1157]|nr:hypothetical protein SL1157_A0243 [Ruegeria lacuscaerulensis ITI-1157]SHJ79260.1 hypothetical protein SAMN05444404_2681 [Ruegeria lacuscaerulensis ITI-1157]
MTEQINSAAAEQDAVFLARESFAGELKNLNKQFPNTGFGIALRTHSGEEYFLANARMPLPGRRGKGFPTGRRVARLDNGDHFSSIEVLADSRAYEKISPGTEAEILGNALELIARIDSFAGTAPMPTVGNAHPAIAATGTGG